MSVRETTSIDQVAVSDSGRVLLAMTEDRPYTPANSAELGEQFRLKLNSYVYAARSGQLADTVPSGPSGYDIVLYCGQQPPSEVIEMVDVANRALAGENITVSYRLLDTLAAAMTAQPPDSLDVDGLVQQLAQAMYDVIPAGAAGVVYRPALMVRRNEDDFIVDLGNDQAERVPPPARVRELIPWLRYRMYEPDRGTWLSAWLRVQPDGSVQTSFNYDTEPEWNRPVSADDYRAELDEYPRSPEHIPDWLRARLAS